MYELLTNQSLDQFTSLCGEMKKRLTEQVESISSNLNLKFMVLFTYIEPLINIVLLLRFFYCSAVKSYKLKQSPEICYTLKLIKFVKKPVRSVIEKYLIYFTNQTCLCSKCVLICYYMQIWSKFSKSSGLTPLQKKYYKNNEGI